MNHESLPIVPGANALGHVHLFQSDRLAFCRSAAQAGPVARMRFLHRWVLMVSSPESAHEVLVEQARSFEKSPGIRIVLRDLAGDGLFTSEGDLWQRQRRLMSPLFHAQNLKPFAQTMNQVASSALDRFRDGETVDLAHEMMRVTMGVVGATLFGADTYEHADDLGEALTVALKWVDDNLGSAFLTLQISVIEALEKLQPHVPAPLRDVQRTIEAALRDPVLLPSRRDAALHAAIRKLDTAVLGMIDERRRHPSERADLLTRLLLARDTEGGHNEGMSDRQLRDEANTLFVAGHETTANALAWAFYLLARNPEARARVQAEADAFGPEGPTSFEPEKLAYTSRVFREALRMYPPVILLPRRSLVPVTLAGQTYPARTIVFVNPYGIHMTESVFPDPDRFDPDRFLPEREATRHKSSWIPFGAGPRVCIGNNFALMEGPIVMATLMRRARFEIDATRKIEAAPFATLRPMGGVPAVVRRTA